MRITFVLPAPVRVPMGGAAVVYAYADQLAAFGHVVHVLGPESINSGIVGRARAVAIKVRNRVHGVAEEPYYKPSAAISIDVPTVSREHVPDGDVVIATGSQTAEAVAELPAEKGVGCYFIQGDETFVRPDARGTWALPLARLTCARWLRAEVEAAGYAVVDAIPNAIDPTIFGLDAPIASRAPRIVALYHRHPVKGPDLLLETLRRLRDFNPAVEADLFAARPPAHDVPGWVTVHVRPSTTELRALYNGAALLLHTSRSEGWPLVPMEAAACGAAVVAMSNHGIREYLTADETMVAVPPGEVESLAIAANDLLRDEVRRIALAERAAGVVGSYVLADNARRLERALLKIVGRAP